MKAYLRLLRPKQWAKNLLIFAAILFTNGFHEQSNVIHVLGAFVAMCLLSSGVYIFNDLHDVERDRAHPQKKLRPIASGTIKPAEAIALALICAIGAGIIIAFLGKKVIAVVIAYLILQLAYNFGGKRVPVLDVFLIGSGFVLRAVLGAAAINVKISAWLVLCTGALALMLAFAKRRHEFIVQGENRTASRVSLGGYSQQSLDALVIMTSTAAALCYGLYALESLTAQKYPALFFTTIFVFYGICRYVLIVFVNDAGGEPENVLFRDRHIQLSVLLFILAAVIAISGVNLPLIDINRFGGIR